MSPEFRVDALDLLTKHGWLAKRDPEFRKLLLRASVVKSYEDGAHLYLCGDAPDGLYGILSGAVRVTVPADDGQEYEAHRARAGFWVGDLALLSDTQRLISLAAVGPTRALFVPITEIARMLRDNPLFYREFYALSSQNMSTSLRILANLAVRRADQKVALRLLHLDETLPRPGDWIQLRQNELADMVALSGPTLQRALQALAARGFLEIGYRRIRILNRAELMEMCQS